MIGLVDFGSGNFRSVSLAVRRCGDRAKVVRRERELQKLNALILPGVGSFEVLKGQDALVRGIRKFAASGRPVLGICLGMQALFERSEECAGVNGLSLIRGAVKKLNAPRLPQMGWNQLRIIRNSQLLDGIADGTHFYFANSYACFPEEDVVSAACDYDGEFAAVVEKETFFGVQFHPEKSGEAGLRVLKNFVEMCG
ncbi:MAG: imidazole glycerol phosphate synthase subunit HisH [Candidatus Burarchaeum sp.]|nr:imidazole glycerol phosphate synthase subunit HisH [Candidatus Burarchaeum sp.]MDO8339188.1 imidazole glycerol phosphate synthase subunit HisH [Candidatus Burarchaeum sp.]